MRVNTRSTVFLYLLHFVTESQDPVGSGLSNGLLMHRFASAMANSWIGRDRLQRGRYKSLPLLSRLWEGRVCVCPPSPSQPCTRRQGPTDKVCAGGVGVDHRRIDKNGTCGCLRGQGTKIGTTGVSIRGCFAPPVLCRASRFSRPREDSGVFTD